MPVRCSHCEFKRGQITAERGNFCPACGRRVRGQRVLITAFVVSIVMMIGGVLFAFGHLPDW